MEYMTTQSMHEMSKKNNRKSQDNDANMVLQQSKANNAILCQGRRTCFYVSEPGHIAFFASR